MPEIPPDIPLYAFIKRELKSQIESGELPEGARVPSEFELARSYSVSRNPTRQALRDLEREGYIIRTPGRGSFVAPVQSRQRLLPISGWRTVALACPELECRYTRSVVQGFIQSAAEDGVQTMVYFVRFSNESEFDFLTDMRNSGIEGIAFWLQHATDRTLDLLRKFRRSGFPFVLIDRYVHGVDADYVVTDNEDVGFQLTDALIRRGHTEIAFVANELMSTSSEDRLAGHRRALEEAGLTFTRDLVGLVDPKTEPVTAVTSRIMAYRHRPTAFCCLNDFVASTLLDELTNLGYSVPEDVELALVDDSRMADALGIPMIAAVQAGAEMGRESAQLLLRRIAEPDRPIQKRFLKAVLQDGHEEPGMERLAVKGGGLNDD